MDAKLNHSDLSALLAKELNISNTKSEQFTKAFFDLIIEGLATDGIVKINGLGTFKVTDVASRGSVDVNTGAKIEIKGHKKLSFIPAESLKDEVNRPFAMFEPVEVDDTYQDEEPVNEVVDETIVSVEQPSVPVEEIEEEMSADETVLPVEHSSAPVEEIEEEMPANETVLPVEQPSVPVKEIEEEMPADETALPVEHSSVPVEEIEEEIPAEETVLPVEQPSVPVEKVEEEVPVEDNDIADTVIDDAATVPTPEKVVVESADDIKEHTKETKPAEPVAVKVAKNQPIEEKPKEKGGKKWLVIVVLFIAVVLIIGNRLISGDTGQVSDQASSAEVNAVSSDNRSANETKTPETVDVQEEIVPEVIEEVYTFEMVDELASRNVRSITVADTLHYVSAGEWHVHKVAEDETLVKIANKYYGDKRLWPYLAKYNNLANPNGLSKNMEIVVPMLKARRQ